MEHLTKNFIDQTCDRLWTVRGSLKGLAGLFTTGTRDICFDGDEFYGVGQLLKRLGEELEIIEDLIRCGKDSMANQRNGLTIEDNGHEEDVLDDKEAEKLLSYVREIIKNKES